MWSQFNAVNNNLSSRIKEIQDAKNKLQSHLQRVNDEISQLHRCTGLIKKAIEAQCTALKLAMTRLKERKSRINVELCHDPPMKVLNMMQQELVVKQHPVGALLIGLKIVL